MKKIVLSVAAILIAAGVASADPAPIAAPAKYVPLTEAQMGIFLNALSEISMPQRAYQQIIGVYKQLEQEAQRGRDTEHK